MRERFVGERIEPVSGSGDARGAARGEPGLPREFVWRGRRYEVQAVLDAWKETSPCRHGSDELYVRKHWFRILTGGGVEMKVYFERQARSGRERKRRWWLFGLSAAAEG